jgi:hypothetical protein
MTEQFSPPSAIRLSSWQRAIEVALNEPDPNRRLELVLAAEAAIFNRLQELAQNPEEASHRAERQAICSAF